MEWILISVLAVLTLALLISAIYVKHSEKAEQKSDIIANYDEQQARAYGEKGERKVKLMLEGIANQYLGHVYNKYIFEDEQGFSSEIDHILVTIGGVFIVETKNYKGTIIGTKDDEYWNCIKEKYQEDKELENPLRQNQGHINHLRRMFKKNPPHMSSVIIFPEANLSCLDIPNVYSMELAKEFIEDCIQKSIHKKQYSKNFVKCICEQLDEIIKEHGITEHKHLENIQKKS